MCRLLNERLENLSVECTKLTQDFADISSELEMKGAEARKTMRQVRQEIEDCSFKCGNSLKRRKKELETSVKKEDIVVKVKEVKREL